MNSLVICVFAFLTYSLICYFIDKFFNQFVISEFWGIGVRRSSIKSISYRPKDRKLIIAYNNNYILEATADVENSIAEKEALKLIKGLN